MRPAQQRLGLSGLLAIGLASAHAFAEDPPPVAADTPHNTEEPPEARPAPKPKVGDVSVSGYFRGGFGASNQKGRMTCFQLANPAGLFSKYRLGNECEVWSETHFTMVTYVGDDDTLATLHFMPTVYIPTTYTGYSPNGTVNSPAIYTTSSGATVSFPNLYADLKGIPWLHGGTAWAGTRYYKRESVYISDFFYWNPSGVGAGIEDIALGRDLRLSYAAFAVDGEPGTPTDPTAPPLPSQFDFGVRSDVQLRGIKPWEGGDLQLGFQYIANWTNKMAAAGNTNTTGGYGFTVQLVHKLLGGDNKLALQYGKGGGTGFGTLSRFYYPDFSLYFAPSEYRIRVVEVLTVQPTGALGAQVAGVYQRDQNFLGVSGQNTQWVSAGGRVSYGFARHVKLQGEVGFDRVTKSNGSDPQWLAKFTVAPTLAAGPGLLNRPELRVFYTWAVWNEAARTATVDSGRLYTTTNFLSGAVFGLQAETWW